MKSQIAPIDLGTLLMDPTTLMVVGIVGGVVAALVLGARRDTAVFAISAGIIGVFLAV